MPQSGEETYIVAGEPTWQFPPRNGGIDYIQDPSSAYFRDDPLPKLVREVVQNSLDAKKQGLPGPVKVSFLETTVDPSLIGASQLKQHLYACMKRVRDEGLPNVQTDYARALKALESDSIPCLRIVDSGTTGLKGASWNRLVVQEGGVHKLGSAPGGFYGIGKNAVFNVSDLRTVFYSTRYVTPREGRALKLQGKATLMTHPDPKKGLKDLQHIGFFSMAGGQPILGRNLNSFFRLDEDGTGVFVMGFSPRCADWTKEVATAAAENFFYAIHHKQLVVDVSVAGADGVAINHETLDGVFETHRRDTPAHHYYKAIRDHQAETIDGIGKIGPLNVHVYMGAGPRRIAYINRNGMLITDSTEQRANPMAPRRNSLWPKFAAVIVPASDEGDRWIRQTENVSHDSMAPRQFEDPKKRREAEAWFKGSRDAIRELIDRAAHVDKQGDTSNLDELAAIFPDEFDPSAPGNRLLKTRTIDSRIPGPTLPQAGPDPALGPDPNPDPKPNPSMEPKPPPNPNPNPGPSRPRPTPNPRTERRARLQHPRFIPTGSANATVLFTAVEDPPKEVKLVLMPAGGEWGQETRVMITEAVVRSPEGQEASLDEGSITLTPRPHERVVIDVVTSDPIDNLAFRIV